MTTQTQNGCDQLSSGLLSVESAQRKILDLVEPIHQTELLPINQALHRVLAQAVQSNLAIPSFDNSAMDGYAVSSQSFKNADPSSVVRLTVVGESFAGAPYTGAPIASNECVRIMTGAVLPNGADAVVMQEQVERDGTEAVISGSHSSGENVRYIGEDVKVGDEILPAGKLLRAADIGLLAAVGQTEVSVYRKLNVAFFSTGDELKSIDQTLEPGQIYDSNRYLLASVLAPLQVNVNDLGVLKDDRDLIKQTLSEASKNNDVIITSGGVSVGEADFVKQVLDELGQVHFWRVAMKPGKPLAIGSLGGCTFFGLPGNPVSVFATFYQFVLAALYKLMGAKRSTPVTFNVRCVSDLKKAPGRTEFQRGILTRNEQGEWEVAASGGQGSHMLKALAGANCFILLDAENAGVKAGELVTVQPFYGALD